MISFTNTTSTHNNLIDCKESPERKFFHKQLRLVWTSALIVFGTIGNIASIRILRRQSYKNNRISDTLCYLSVLDTIILWTTVLKIFIEGFTGGSKDKDSTETCIVMILLSELISSIDNWVLVNITLWRALHIKFPYYAQRHSKLWNHCILHFIQHFILILGFSLAFLYVMSNMDKDGREPCVPLLLRSFDILARQIDCLVNFVIPAVLLFFLNMMIAHELRLSKKRQERLQEQPLPLPNVVPSSTIVSSIPVSPTSKLNDQRLSVPSIINMKNLESLPLPNVAASSTIISSIQVPPTSNAKKDLRVPVPSIKNMNYLASPSIISSKSGASSVRKFPKDTRFQSLTNMLIIAYLVFLVLNIPYWVFHIFYLDSFNENKTVGCTTFRTLSDALFLTRCSNHSLNFYFYCATGPRFRNELYTMLRRSWGCCKK